MKRWTLWGRVLRCAVVGGVLAGATGGEVGAADEDAVIRLQLKWVHQAQFAGYYMAEAKGYYADAGLRVEILEGGAARPPVRQVLEDHADFGVSDSDVLLQRLNGNPLVACAAIFQHTPYVFMSLRERNIHVPSDLVGARVMLSDDQGAAQLWAMLTHEGIDPSQVSVQQHSWDTDDLVQGRVDAVSAYAMMEPIRLQAKGIETTILRSLDYGIDFYGDTLFTTESFVRRRPEATWAFVRASLKGWAYAFAHPEETADVIAGFKSVQDRGDDRALILRQLEAMRPYVLPDLVELGHMNVSRWKHIAGVFAERGMAPATDSLEGFMLDPHPPGEHWLSRRTMGWVFGLLGVMAAVLFWNLQVRRQVNAKTRVLRASEEVQRHTVAMQTAILNALPAEVALLDQQGAIVAVNEAWHRVNGERVVPGRTDPFIGQNYIAVCQRAEGEGQEDARRVAAGITAVLNGQQREFSLEYPCHSPTAQHWFRCIVTPVGASPPTGAVVTHFDVTDRKLAELRTHRLNRLYSLSSAVNEAIARISDTLQLYREACRIAVERGGFLMAWVGEVSPGSERLQPAAMYGRDDGYLEAIRITVTPGPMGEGPAGTCYREGRVIFCNSVETDPLLKPWRDQALKRGYRSSAAFPLRQAGKTIGVFTVYAGQSGAFEPEDLRLLTALADNLSFAVEANAHEADRQRAEEALRSSEERFRELAENINEVFWASDPDKQRILYVSPAYEAIWGRSCASLYQSPLTWVEAIHPDDRARVAESARLRQVTGEYNEVYRILRPDGSHRWIRDRAFPVRDENGRVYRIVGTAEDITEQKRMESQFLRAQRMESIGTLAGGIAHDLNNVLTPITLSLQMLQDFVKEEEGRTLLKTLESSAHRGSNLVKQVLSFARGVEGRRASINLLHLLREMERVVADTFPKNIAFVLETCKDPWPVSCDPTQMHQVLMNLFVNARDAMPAGGRIQVTLQNVELDSTYATMNPEARPGRHLVVSVVDDGMGMTPEVLDKIFEPFFTTKEVGQGTGLGLPTSLAIVRSHGGFINVYSEPGHGSTFKVYLPAEASGSVSADVTEAPAKRPRGAGEVVLLVDDEESIRTVARGTLERFSYRVMEARHGAEAVAIYAQHQDVISAVLTDMAMPIMDGPALIMALKAINPKVRIIASSGLASNGGVAKAIGAGVADFVPKPYTADVLLATLRRVLDDGVPPARS